MASDRHESVKAWVRRATPWINYDISRIKRFRTLVNSGSRFFKSPKNIKTVPVTIGTIPAELIIPAKVKLDGVIFFMHGGGYCIGSLDSHRALIGKIALEAKIKAIHIDYRLAPEHPYPAAVEDAIEAYEWLQKKGFPAEKIIFMGDSAGGGLLIATMLELKNRGMSLPNAAVCMSPWVDLSFSGASAINNAKEDPIIPVPKVHHWAKAYAGNLPLEHPGISPLYATDFSGLPPILIQASDLEVLSDDSVRIVEKLKQAEVDVTFQTWEGVMHVWQITWRRKVPESLEAIEKIKDFLTKWLT